MSPEILKPYPEKLLHLHPYKTAGILIINPSNTKILLGLNQETNEQGTIIASGWGNPAGSKLPDETPILTCIRETKEEFGLLFNPSQLSSPLILICERPKDQKKRIHIAYCFLATLSTSITPSKSSEVKEFKWWSKQEIIQLTDGFMDHEWLWGGAWTEMILRRWVETNNPNQFPGIISFSLFAPGRWRSSYDRIKNH